MSAYIARVGYTKVGDHWNQSLPELGFAAGKDLLKDSNLKPDALIVSNALSDFTAQANIGPLVADSLGLEGVDTFKVESSGASGAIALHVANSLISSGQVDSALVVGIEKMRDIEPSKLVLAQALSENSEYSQFFGISLTSKNALLARLYMDEFGISRQQLSAFPVIAHKNGTTAAHAQFKRSFSIDDVGRSEMIADPLRTLDCAPVGDGAAALLVVSERLLPQHGHNVRISASESSSNGSNYFERENLFRMRSTEAAAKKALKKSGLSTSEISFFEIHDTFSIAAALSVEALGLAKEGGACEAASFGAFDLKGKHPISTFGGMKARGYPIGAAGVYQICEAYLQLKDKAGANQVANAKHGLIHSMSGIDSSAVVHVLSRS